MATTPDNLLRWLPDCYDKDSASDLYKLFDSFAVGTEAASSAASDFYDDAFLASTDGDGLTRFGENYAIQRPPGMIDARFKAALQAILSMGRGTVAIIKAVFEALTGITATVQDIQLNGSIPSYEIWITPGSSGLGLYGRGFYPDQTTNYSEHPVESAIGGPVFEGGGYYGGLFNDHTDEPFDVWIIAILEKIKPAGTTIVFK